MTTKKRKREKLFRCHSALLKFYNMLTAGKVIIGLVILAFFLVQILPSLCYAAAAFDRHHFGFFHEREPVFAKTTANQKYYAEHGIPYVTAADINNDYRMVAKNKSKGLPAHYELNHKQHYTFTNGVKKIYRSLPSLPLQGLRRHLETEGETVEGAEASAANDTTQQPGGIPPEENTTTRKKNQFDAAFPNAFMTKEQIQNGGFIVYFLGIMYMFQGISLVTQNYINPAIDTIKKKGILGSDTMNATLLAFSNSAAESFIVVNSIFFRVPDIGIQTAVQQCAFYALIIQGYFYTLADENTRIDWWISIRDSVLFLIYLAIMSYFLIGNVIQDYAIYSLVVIYILHVFLMKLNHSYEVALKKAVAGILEVRELNRLAREDISHFHYNLDSRTPCIEILNKINFRQEGDILIFETGGSPSKAAGGTGNGIGNFMNQMNN